MPSELGWKNLLLMVVWMIEVFRKTVRSKREKIRTGFW
jgi:hypothetical protein